MRFFALSADALVPRSRVRRKHAGRSPIQAVNDRSRENCWKHDKGAKLHCSGRNDPKM